MSLTAEDDARAGIPVKREPYPEGEPGIQKSLAEIARKVREGASTACMKSFAGNVLKQAGSPSGARARMEALLDFVRANVMYAPDSPGTEQIQTAAVSLCVDGAPVCIPIGDCDDLVTALATLILAAGIRVRVLRQFFGSEHQQHVLVEAEDERGDWVPLDPSTKYPAGKKAPAVQETRVDPMDGEAIGLTGQDGAQYVGIGGLPVMSFEQGSWHEVDPNAGLGKPEARGDSKWYRVQSPFPAANALLPEQVTFYANEWYYRDGDGAVYQYACCDDCANHKPCGGKENAATAEIGDGPRCTLESASKIAAQIGPFVPGLWQSRVPLHDEQHDVVTPEGAKSITAKLNAERTVMVLQCPYTGELFTFVKSPSGVGRGGGGGGGGGGGHGGGGGGGHGGGGGGGHAPPGWHGGGHGGGGHHVAAHYPLCRFFNGSWWGWNGSVWYVMDAPDCSWGPALVNPSADLHAEASYQLAHQPGPVVRTWTDGNTYMFTGPAGSPTIYPCTGGLAAGAAGLPGAAARRPFG